MRQCNGKQSNDNDKQHAITNPSGQMEKAIIDIIDKKAANQYARLIPSKQRAYRTMLYAGAQITLNGYSVREIAVEIGYSESATSKMAQKWIELMRKGDVTVNLVIAAVQKLPISNRFQCGKTAMQKSAEKAAAAKCQKELPQPATTASQSVKAMSSSKPMNKKILGFRITPEDEMRERAAIRSSILFFQTYGKGAQPRMHGEYYTPGTRRVEEKEDSKKWLPLDTAALYCGCKAEIISKAGQDGVIERRVYKRNANRNYYEYNVADLDKFIRDNHLL